MNKYDLIVVISVRDNPQLGIYYTGPFFGKVRTVSEKNGNFSIRYLNDSDSFRPTRYDSFGYCRQKDTSIYGSTFYRAYTVEQALKYFRDVIDSYEGLVSNPNSGKIVEKFRGFLGKVQEMVDSLQ